MKKVAESTPELEAKIREFVALVVATTAQRTETSASPFLFPPGEGSERYVSGNAAAVFAACFRPSLQQLHDSPLQLAHSLPWLPPHGLGCRPPQVYDARKEFERQGAFKEGVYICRGTPHDHTTITTAARTSSCSRHHCRSLQVLCGGRWRRMRTSSSARHTRGS